MVAPLAVINFGAPDGGQGLSSVTFASVAD
jgi:hypothetical protein